MFYLKYRPQTISELDNEKVKGSLGKSLLNNEFSHAYLLIGTRGSGKTTTARLIAKIVNCTGRKKGEEPCNKCDSCRQIMAGSSLDTIEIDAASNTGVDDIRDLREKVKLAPVSGKYKVYIIDEVHMLSTSAFNALLKTLEEPPPHVIFVLATTEPSKLPETIVSRCLVYDFGTATEAEIMNSLKRKIKSEKLEIDEKTLANIVHLARGSFRDADKLLEQVAKGEKMADSDKVREPSALILREVANGNAKRAIDAVGEFAKSGGNVKELITEMILRLREEMVERPENVDKMEKLIEAYALIRESPIAELPLEMVIVEMCEASEKVPAESGEEKTAEAASVPDSDLMAKWPEIINAVKPYNHNLSALLRSSVPSGFKGDILVIEAFYKFHKDKLSEEKNRKILEDVMSGLLSREIKLKFELKGR